MFKGFRSLAALGAVFLASAGLAACGSSGVPSNAVVQVGSQPITNAAFTHWLGVAAASSAQTAPGSTAPKPVIPDPPTYSACIAHLQATAPKPAKGKPAPTAAQYRAQCEQQYTALKQQVLGFLISANWVIGEASDQGVKVSDAEVEKKFKELKQQQFPKAADFQKFLTSTGQTVPDLLLRVKLNLLSQKIQQKVAKKGTPTQAQIEKYYNENKQRFGQPEKRDLELILTKTQAQAEAAKKEIESGKSFESVAKKYSIDPASKANGGKLPGVVKGQEQKALDAAIFAAKPNTLTGPVKTPFGYYLFEVTAVHPPSQQTLAQVKESIKQQLTAQQQQTALSKFVKEFKKKWEGRTDCRKEYVVMDCKQYKAPKTPAIPGGATPPTGAGTAAPQTQTAPPPATTTTK
jgi:parvulin-like peptidyl-prolyl isomerase